MTMLWRRCEGSGRAVIDSRSWCPGCDVAVVRSRRPRDEPLIGPALLRCAFTPPAKSARIPTHDRVDLVAMIRAGAFGPTFPPAQGTLWSTS